jgi:hypothetical protein
MAPPNPKKLFWTAEQYRHTLIAAPSRPKPAALQVQRFLSRMAALCIVPGRVSISLRVPTGEIREYPFVNPFTGQNLKVEVKEQKALNSVDEVAGAVGSLCDYEIEISGTGKPELPPLPIAFEEAYHVAVTCRVHSELRSTSDLHEDSGSEQKPVPYGEPCPDVPACGYFSNPYTMEAVAVQHAGCSSFWIEFEPGKFLFPEFPDEGLELLNPSIVAEARRVFETEFVQGCYWG